MSSHTIAAKYTLLILGGILIMSILNCAPFLSDQGDFVAIESDAGMIQDCKYLGSVKGSSSIGLNRTRKMKGALYDLRNNAVLLGANTVFIVSTESLFEGTVVTGSAYDCPREGY